MSEVSKKIVKVAILDLYEGQPNQGMRCIRAILDQYAQQHGVQIIRDEFDVRLKNQTPDLDYDFYISSGGPGSPLESENSEWEAHYFHWLDDVHAFNSNPANLSKKYVFFICHSFQLVTRYYHLATVSRRRSTAFGVFPVHLLPHGKDEIIFDGLNDPFYSVDSRDFQVIQPNQERLDEFGAQILALEKERPHVPLERAIMAIRFNDYMIGTQFHPEADALGMSMYLQREDKKQTVIEEHGEEKWQSMIEQLNDPDKILWTYSHILPNFIHTAVSGGSLEKLVN